MVGQAPVIVGFAGVRGYFDGAIVSRDGFFESAGLVVFNAFVKCILRFAGPATKGVASATNNSKVLLNASIKGEFSTEPGIGQFPAQSFYSLTNSPRITCSRPGARL